MLPADYRDPQGRGYGLWKTQEHSALLPCKLGGGGAVKTPPRPSLGLNGAIPEQSSSLTWGSETLWRAETRAQALGQTHLNLYLRATLTQLHLSDPSSRSPQQEPSPP